MLVGVSGCIRELTPTEKCALKGEMFVGHVGDEVRCDVPPGRQDSCVIDATKKFVDVGYTGLGYIAFTKSDAETNGALALINDVFSCQTKYPCDQEGNGPCAK